MRPVIDTLPVSAIDDLEPLWTQLLAHHIRAAPHLAALGAVRTPEESWRLRRAQYREWLREPHAGLLVARGENQPDQPDRLLGYAVVRVVEAPGSWQWGDRVGVLETLVVDQEARGEGVGRMLLDAARSRLDELDIRTMKISVIAGNENAVRFYRREGALDFVQTLVMPVGP